METKLEQIAVKAVNQLPKSVVREIRTPRSVGAGGGRPPPATRWGREVTRVLPRKSWFEALTAAFAPSDIGLARHNAFDIGFRPIKAFGLTVKIPFLSLGSVMQRREFITLLSTAAVIWPFTARAQQTRQISRIGYLGTSSPSLEEHALDAFRQKLRELGMLRARTLPSSTDGRKDRMIDSRSWRPNW